MICWQCNLEIEPQHNCVKSLKAQVARLQFSVRNQCADNLCWLQDPEEVGKALTESEFLESCRRYRNQIAGTTGELTANTMTIAQLEARVLELEKECAGLRTFNEVWVADGGVTWNRPTAWAYAQVCKALEKAQQGWEPDEFESQSHTLMSDVQGEITAALERSGFDPCPAIKIAQETTEKAWTLWHRFVTERQRMKEDWEDKRKGFISTINAAGELTARIAEENARLRKELGRESI